ncbi:MAG: hypothetical protein H7144_13195 [Burkholderiales bacterium]|nr:hypothetical protein [Phycisphaerae bacterium]
MSHSIPVSLHRFRRMTSRTSLLIVLLAICLWPARQSAAFPEPSKYPVSWELKFDYATPKRVALEVPGSAAPKAYWYMTYTVTNKTDDDHEFLPLFEMVTKSGKVIRSDKGIPRAVVDRIKALTANKLLESPLAIAGVLRVGEDQAKDGVAIWEESEPEMGTFSIFITGLSGETVLLNDTAGKPMADKDGKPVILFKTLQLDYAVAGDEVYPGIDPINKVHQRWVMR